MELAGAIAELAYKTLRDEFRNINTAEGKILLLEGMERILPPYPPELSARAEASLGKLGVTVRTKAMVTDIVDNIVSVQEGESLEKIPDRTILWAAGVKASAMGRVLADRADANLDRAGRVIVEPDLSLPEYDNIFVIGDLANFPHQNQRPLPGIAPVAMQQGQYAAKLIQKRLAGNNNTLPPFHYTDAGSLGVIGRNAAVVNLNFARFSGFIAWLFWVFMHIYYLVEFDNKLVVMIQWGWNYFTRKSGARLITDTVWQ